MQNQRRQGIATSCVLARSEKDKNVDSDGRICRRDYSCHCEEAKNLKILPQGDERNFISRELIKICIGDEKSALQFHSSAFLYLTRRRMRFCKHLEA
jgi:hypothetical protein